MAFLKEGDIAPQFSEKDQNGNTISLTDFKGENVIIYFYPKDNTPGCTAESCNLRDNYNGLIEKGFEVIGVSPDSEKSHTNFISKHELPFTLIADTEKNILKAFGAWGPKKMYGREYEGVLRSTFIINGEGKIIKVIEKVKTKDHAAQIFKELNL